MAALQMCNFSSLAEIARAMLGSDEKSSKSREPEGLLPTTGSLEGDVAQIKGLLRFG